MGRNKKWVLEDNLSEAVWRTILRGPRPPSVQWPQSRRNMSAVDDSRAKKGKGKGQGPAPVGKGSEDAGFQHRRAGHPDVVRKSPASSLKPDEQVAAAQLRVTKLEAAIQAVGEDDPAVMGLKEALQKARIQAQLRPVQDRISHTEAFLNRSRKRLETMMSEARTLREDITELELKIQDGERHLEGLRTEASVQPSPFVIARDPQEEIRQLRARIAEMEANGARDGSSKRPKTLASSSLELAPLDSTTRGGALMANLIHPADVSMGNG